MEADVVANDLGPDNVQKKHVAEHQVDAAARRPSVSAWARACTTGSSSRSTRATRTKNGTFISADFNYKAQSRLDFEAALITEVTVPKLDGSSARTRRTSTSSFEPEKVRWAKGGGEDIRAQASARSRSRGCARTSASRSATLPCRAAYRDGRLVHLEVRDRVGPDRYPSRADEAPRQGDGARPQALASRWPTTSRGRTPPRSGSSTATTRRTRDAAAASCSSART